ncbi:MAG: hypothetical protein LCI00_33255 [Chloroflexi bacterium]|nr:hypothetical protein [Chloroflexota bacterium]MCC6896547.1 hypothetical protein [Anaerolineae bacterium]
MLLPVLRRPSTGLVILLGGLLLFGSEVLAWTNPAMRPLGEWLLLLPGYAALSAVLLDLIARYRIRDFFGGLLLAGVYSLIAALALNPASMLTDMPRTLFTRVMGAHALLAAEMLGLFLVLTRGERSRRLLIGCVIVGLAWGVWVKHWPVAEGYGEVALPTMLAFGVAGVAVIALLLYGLLPRVRSENSASLDTLRLSPRGWAVVVAVLAGLTALRLVRGEVDAPGLVLCPLLLALCWAVIWFRGRKTGDTLLDRTLHLQPLSFPNFLLAAVIFLGVGVLGYNLPATRWGTVTPFTLIGLGFTAYGLAWLPTVSLVLGVQGYLRQLASRKM